jgi:hypothetical protein
VRGLYLPYPIPGASSDTRPVPDACAERARRRDQHPGVSSSSHRTTVRDSYPCSYHALPLYLGGAESRADYDNAELVFGGLWAWSVS